MPGLKNMLSSHDLDFLNRVAWAWGVTISQHDVEAAVSDLLGVMLRREKLEGVISSLPAETLVSWEELVSNDGQVSWASFSRKHGDIRAIGPARRERENPDLAPISASERLWYSGLVGRAFFKPKSDVQEYIYIPDELYELADPAPNGISQLDIRPAVNQTPGHTSKAGTRLLDHMTDFLAAARMNRPLVENIWQTWGVSQDFLFALAKVSGLLEPNGQPNPEQLKTFFKIPNEQAMRLLFQAWWDSCDLNDLHFVPGITCEGVWRNDPLAVRKLLGDILHSLQLGTWWSISSLLTNIKNKAPDFQRPAGDYDSWYIKDANTGEPLTGFTHWDEVEGALIAFLVIGPLYWFGLVDLAKGKNEKAIMAFRLTSWANALLSGISPDAVFEEDQQVIVKKNTTLIVPHGTPRALRYQVGRFTQFMQATPEESWFQVTTTSLKEAAAQGLQPVQLVKLLEKHTRKALPSGLTSLLERWQTNGQEVVISHGTLLRFTSDFTLDQIQKDPKICRFIIEVLNPRTVLVKREQVDELRVHLAETGLLLGFEPEV